MMRVAPLGAALLTGLAAWLSQGTIGFAAPEGGRLGLLPLSPGALAWCAAAGGAVLLLRWKGASLLPLFLLGVLFLPWLPFPVPPAFLIWVKPLALLVWAAVALLMVASLPSKPHVTLFTPRIAAAVCAFVLFSASAWRAAPMRPGGDEPHYLVITQSLLIDGDLTIEDVHRRGDYRAYFSGDLPPHVQRRGRDGQIYSVHAPGLPALVAPAFAIGGYQAVVIFLVLLASAGSALAWHLARLATGRDDAAWFGWAAVTLPVTATFQSFTVYPDGPGGVLALTGLWALMRADQESGTGARAAGPWFLHGVALALLPWMHSRFAVIAGGFGALILLRLSNTKNPAGKAVAFLSVPAISAILWVGFFIAIYGSPDPSAPYGPGELGSLAFVPGGLAGLLFDQRFGLLTYAPVLAVAFAGLGMMLARRETRRLAIELLFVTVPYLLTVTHFAMWWGGWSPPARFFAAILPLWAVPAAAAWLWTTRRASRAVALAALILTAFATAIVVVVDRGRLAFNTRDTPALWLEWFGRAADLAAAAPSWARDTDVPLFRTIVFWVAVVAAAWAVLRAIDARGRFTSRAAFATATAGVLAVAMMIATSAVWAFEGTSGRSVVRSQLGLLDAVAAEPRALGLELDAFSRFPAAAIPGRIRIEVLRVPGRRGGGPLFTFPPLPAGEYRVHVEGTPARGWVMIGIARDPRDPFALRTVQLPAEPLQLDFPVPVRALVVRGDEDASRTVRQIAIEPVRLARAEHRLTDDLARRGVRYGAATIYFLDDGSFPEPEAFWVGGSRESRIVIDPDAARSSVTLRLRNAPVGNRISISNGAWTRGVQLAPGEEQQLEIPLDPARGAALVRLSTSFGFTPADHEPGNRDRRFLGVWVKLE